MAGDWIKLECTTPDKPEIVQMAQQLGIDQDAVVGKCLRVWIWADQQSTSGNALSVTESFLDRITYCNGFAEAMKRAGWLSTDGNKLELPNFGRHNGQTAKTRALTGKRVEKSRTVKRKCNDASVTESLPEKRREEKSSIKTEEQAVACVAPAWQSEIVDAFNATFGAECRLTKKRTTALAARWNDPWWRDNWRAALDRGSGSAFLRGANDRGWMIDFEFFLKPDTVSKILEGKYDNRGNQSRKQTHTEQREQLNASSFDWIRQAAAAEAASSGDHGSDVPSGAGAVVFIEGPGRVDAACG